MTTHQKEQNEIQRHELAALIEDRWRDERHEQNMARILLGLESVEVLAICKVTSDNGARRVDLWAPMIERDGFVGMYRLCPAWREKHWRYNDSGYGVKFGGAHDVLYGLGLEAANLLGLDPHGRWLDDPRPPTGLPVWRVLDHLPRYRESWR